MFFFSSFVWVGSLIISGALDTEIIHESPDNDTLSRYVIDFVSGGSPFTALVFLTTIHESMEYSRAHTLTLLIHKYAVLLRCLMCSFFFFVGFIRG